MTGRRRASPAAILAVVCFGVFVAADDLTVVSTMLRQIIGDLNIPLPDGWDRAAWIVNSYLVAYVAVMPFMGRLSDVLGRRRVFVGALVLFLAGSAWTPFATSLGPFPRRPDHHRGRGRGHGAGGPGRRRRRLRRAPPAGGPRRARGGRHHRLGVGAPLRRPAGALPRLALAVLPEHPPGPGGHRRRLVGAGRPRPPGRPAPHRLAGRRLPLLGAGLPEHRPGQHQRDLRRRRPGGTDRPPLPADGSLLRGRGGRAGPLPVPRAPLPRPRGRPAPLPPPQLRPGDGRSTSSWGRR